MSHHCQSAEQFHDDVLAHVQESGPPGVYTAINLGDVVAALGKIRPVVQQLLPVIETFTPPQYRAVVTLVAGLLQGALSGVDGGPPTVAPGV
jgi:hypothetical protein